MSLIELNDAARCEIDLYTFSKLERIVLKIHTDIHIKCENLNAIS